jgi:hypothetical protein
VSQTEAPEGAQGENIFFVAVANCSGSLKCNVWVLIGVQDLVSWVVNVDIVYVS